MIESEEGFWSYELKGVVTAYKPPVIESRLRKLCGGGVVVEKGLGLLQSSSAVTLMKSSFIRSSSQDIEKTSKTKY